MKAGRVLQNFWKKRLNAVQHEWTDDDLQLEPPVDVPDDPWGEVLEPRPRQGQGIDTKGVPSAPLPLHSTSDDEGGEQVRLEAGEDLTELLVFDEGWGGVLPRNDGEAESLLFDLAECDGELDILPPWDDDDPPVFLDQMADIEGDLDLPAFDPEARRDFPVPGDELPFTDRAVLRANHLATLAETVTRTDRRRWVDALRTLFLQFQHGASYLAVAALVEGGIDLETMQAVWSVKSEWEAHPQWWVQRRIGREVTWFAGAARYDMTWRLAHALVAAFPDDEPECLLEAWWDDWLSMRPATPGYNDFASFIRLRLNESEAILLDEGLRVFSEARVTEGRFSVSEFLRDRGM